MQIDARASDILRQQFGLDQFRKGQTPVLASVLAGRDTLAVMPTGGGKSLCYQLPALYFGGLVVVVSPLIALMKDQVRQLRARGIPAGGIHSGQTLEEKREIFRDLRAGGPYLLYLSPERVQTEGFIGWLAAQKVVLFAIDEAHCVSQWGHDFREDYAKLSILRQLKPEVPLLALTATATPRVLNDIERQLGVKQADRHVHGFYRPNLFYQVETCPDDAYRFEMLLSAIRRTPEGRILVYSGTRNGAESLAEALGRQFEKVDFYHAGMSAADRKTTQERIDRGEVRIVVATNAFGMGIDYPDVRLVVHMQAPANVESLYQEMGRAGRDGRTSRCLLLYAKKDRGLHAYFIQQSTASREVINQRWRSLEALIQFVESAECRHAGILTYFRDADRLEACGHCDICAPRSEWVIERPSLAARAVAAKARTRKAKAPAPETLHSPDAEARALVLRDWRKRFAKERDIPPFIVFSDRTLRDLANRNPESLEALADVYGLGPAKIELFGRELLQELGR